MQTNPGEAVDLTCVGVCVCVENAKYTENVKRVHTCNDGGAISIAIGSRYAARQATFSD